VNQLGDPERSQCLSALAKGVVETLSESYLESKEVVKTDKFTKFGLTDCGIIKVVPTHHDPLLYLQILP